MPEKRALRQSVRRENARADTFQLTVRPPSYRARGQRTVDRCDKSEDKTKWLSQANTRYLVRYRFVTGQLPVRPIRARAGNRMKVGYAIA